jgi:hypothetical protein
MDKISSEYGRKLKYIKSKLPKRNFYTMHEFFLVCPYTLDEMKIPNRSRDIMQWRQLGMTWACLCGSSTVEAGKMFCKDHATVVYSQEMVVYALDGFHPMIREKLQDVIDCVEIAQHASNDPNTNVIIASRQIEKLLRIKYSKFKPTI